MLTHLTHWHDNAEIVRLATSANGELLAMSGPRNPYQAKLGVIEADALADLLVVDGNPINDIDLVATPDKSCMIIVKDGQIYKDPRRSALGRADWCLSSTRTILQPPAKVLICRSQSGRYRDQRATELDTAVWARIGTLGPALGFSVHLNALALL